jgi:DUF4097 and DUF4098 domain-containing protein YvlB
MHDMTALIVALVVTAAAPGAALAQSSSGDAVRIRVQQTQREEQRRVQRERMIEQRRAAEDRNYPARQEERINRTLKLGGRGELTISNLVGDIVVTRRGGDEVQIEALKIARGRTEQDAREALPLVQVSVQERAGRGDASVTYPQEHWNNKRRNANVSVHFTISAPENTRLTIKTLSGDIKVSDIKGELALVTTSGDVAITNAGRVSEARSTAGNVELTSTTSENAIELTTISGDVIARQVKAPRIELETVSGRVVMENLEVARIDAQSITGTIDFTGRLARNGRYDFNSHGGTIRLALIGDTGFELDANSFSGEVRSDIPLKLEEDEDPRTNRRGGRRSMQGVFGDGSALIDVTTFSGSVVLTRK